MKKLEPDRVSAHRDKNETLDLMVGVLLMNRIFLSKKRDTFTGSTYGQHPDHLYKAVVFVLNDDKRANFHSTDIGIYRRNINKFDCNTQVSNVLSQCHPVYIKVVTLFFDPSNPPPKKSRYTPPEIMLDI